MPEKNTTEFNDLGEQILVSFYDGLTGEIPDPEFTRVFLIGRKMTGWTTATIGFQGKEYSIDTYESTNVWVDENDDVIFSIPFLSEENGPNEKLAVACMAAAPINPRT